MTLMILACVGQSGLWRINEGQMTGLHQTLISRHGLTANDERVARRDHRIEFM